MSVVYSEGQLSALYETLSTLGDQRDEYKNAIVREETRYGLERKWRVQVSSSPNHIFH